MKNYQKMKIATVLVVALLTMALSGCGAGQNEALQNTEPSVQNTEPLIQSESALPELSADEQVTTGVVPDIDEPGNNLKEFSSDFGYTISYEEDSFDYRRTEGYDEFILKSDAVDKPFVFVCISHIDAEFTEQVKTSALGENPDDCVIGQAQMAGQCSETEEDWDGGKIIHKTYFCPLDSGDALLIETQWYTEQSNDPFAAWLWEMVSSIKVSKSASDGISADVNEHGLLSGYDAESRKLTYTPIEIVEESDAERIAELEELGVQLEFPNGYYICQSNEFQLSFPVAESVTVSLLNDEFMLVESDMNAVAERLEGHPPFFLCKLHIVEGTIMGIEERFVP